MRNLKKILALVLALMMVLSVMVTASAATFPDDADIDYKEAVDVMVAAGILKGDGEGNFNPDKALERSSAAKLIAYLMLQEDIDYVDQSATEFGDVPAAHWASGYIAYVAENDIVVGTGAGNYNPNGAVNGYSFAKMVLLAMCEGNKEDMMELDPTAEWNYVTSEWKVAPFTGNYTLKVRLAIAHLKNEHGIDLLAGLEKVSLNADLTREQAAQLVFNALNDTGVLEGTYGLTKETYDKAGLTYSKWIYTNPTTKKTTDVTEPVLLDTYVETFGAGTTYADIAAALGLTEKSKATPATRYWNTVNPDTVDMVEVYVGNKTSKIALARTVDVYATAEGGYKLMHTTEALVNASVADKAETTGDNKGLYAWTFGTATKYAAKDAYTKGAAYLAVIGDGELVAEPKLAKTVEGKITSKGSDYVRLAGSTTKYTVKYTAQIPEVLNAAETKVLYLATDGTVLAITNPAEAPAVETTETLVYVLGFYSVYVPEVKGTDPVYNQYGELIKEGTEGTKAYYKRMAQCVNMDGEIVDYLYADKQAQASAWGNNPDFVNKLHAVTVNSKTGVATFTAPEGAVAVNAEQFTEGNKKFTIGETNYYYTAAEFVNVVGNKSAATVAAGNLKGAVKAASTAWAIFAGEGKNMTVSKIIYWTAPAGAPVVDPDTYHDMFVVANATSTDSGLIDTVDAEGKADTETVYFHTVYVNGKKAEIMTYDADITAGAKSYQVDKYGVYVKIENLKNAASGKVTNLYGTLATVADFVDYDIEGVTVIDVTSNGNGTVEAGETVTVVYNVDKTTGAKTMVVIYITTSIKAK